MKADPAARFQRVTQVARRATISRWRAACVATCLALCAPASCGDEKPGPSDTDAADSCTGEGDSYKVGLSKTSNAASFTVELVDANPAPPGVGTNAWKLRLKDGGGNAVVGAIVNINLYMPKHRHAPAGTVGADRGDGAYDVTDLNLVMPGLFDVTIEVTAPGHMTDSAQFQFCVGRKGD
jgi:hypothetical protein